MIRNKFETIPTNSISLFLNDNDTANNYNTGPDSPACNSRPSHNHSLKMDVKTTPVYLPHEAVEDVLPYCSYKPSYLTIKEAPEGPKMFYDFLNGHLIPIGSYPAVEYKTVINKFPEFGNHFLGYDDGKKGCKEVYGCLASALSWVSRYLYK